MGRADRPTVHGRDHRFGSVDPIPPSRWIIIGDTGAPAFVNDWEHGDAVEDPVRFRMLAGGCLQIRGYPFGGVSGTIVFTLPSGYEPEYQERHMGVDPVWLDDSTKQPRFTAHPNGDVYVDTEDGE